MTQIRTTAAEHALFIVGYRSGPRKGVRTQHIRAATAKDAARVCLDTADVLRNRAVVWVARILDHKEWDAE